MSTEQKTLTLGAKSEELRAKAVRDKWLKLQEYLTDLALAQAQGGKDIATTIESLKIVHELLDNTKNNGDKK